MEAIIINNLNKSFYVLNKGLSLAKKLKGIFVRESRIEVKAIQNLNLEVSKGEYLGIIGKNGSGKSTLLKIILGAMDPDVGSEVFSKGRVMRLALGMGFDESLSARDNIYLNGAILGIPFNSNGLIIENIISFAELEKFTDIPVKYFSSGMKSRLAFAIAIHADADIYLIDEFFSDVGDEFFKAKSQKAFEDKIAQGKTVLHVTHNMQLLKHHCDRILVMNEGRGKIFENLEEALKEYKSYYTHL